MGGAVRHARVRQEMGVSRPSVAKWAGCSIATVTLFESNPASVGPEKREGLERVYRELRAALERLQPVYA